MNRLVLTLLSFIFATSSLTLHALSPLERCFQRPLKFRELRPGQEVIRVSGAPYEPKAGVYTVLESSPENGVKVAFEDDGYFIRNFVRTTDFVYSPYSSSKDARRTRVRSDSEVIVSYGVGPRLVQVTAVGRDGGVLFVDRAHHSISGESEFSNTGEARYTRDFSVPLSSYTFPSNGPYRSEVRGRKLYPGDTVRFIPPGYIGGNGLPMSRDVICIGDDGFIYVRHGRAMLKITPRDVLRIYRA